MSMTRRKTSTAACGPTLYQLESGSVGSKAVSRPPPRNLLELRDRLTRCRFEGAASVAAVATFAIAQPLDVAFGTARGAASACSVSTTSVLRLATMSGFESFHDMREFFRGLLRSTPASLARSTPMSVSEALSAATQRHPVRDRDHQRLQRQANQ